MAHQFHERLARGECGDTHGLLAEDLARTAEHVDSTQRRGTALMMMFAKRQNHLVRPIGHRNAHVSHAQASARNPWEQFDSGRTGHRFRASRELRYQEEIVGEQAVAVAKESGCQRRFTVTALAKKRQRPTVKHNRSRMERLETPLGEGKPSRAPKKVNPPKIQRTGTERAAPKAAAVSRHHDF